MDISTFLLYPDTWLAKKAWIFKYPYMYYTSIHRENKTLSDEIKDLMEQISEGGRSIHEIEKQRKRLETEKFELETCLGDAESALEQEENKLLRLSLEVNQVRADIEKRIQEKEEEFEGNNLTQVNTTF